MRRLLKLPKKHDLPVTAIVAHVTDLASGETFFDIAFRGEDGSRKSIRVPREIVRHHPAKMRDLLSKFGAALPTDQKKLEALTKKLSTDDAPNWLVVAPTLGWQQSRKAFVAHSRILGENGDGSSAGCPKLIPPGPDDARSTAAMRQCGNLASWKRDVVETATYSSTIALSLSVAFAAPLLSVVDWPTFMVVLFGPGKVGKSTAAIACACCVDRPLISSRSASPWRLAH